MLLSFSAQQSLRRYDALPTSPSIRAVRRLIHALLLGHIQSLPTLDDLRSMRDAFSRKASTASRTSLGEPLNRSPTAKGPEHASSAAQAPPTLRIPQRHLSGIPFWFEREEHEAERGGERAGSDGLSSTIRAVYADAWGGDDGRVDGLDLLLTLCAVPGDAAPESGAVDGEGDEESGKRRSLFWVGLNVTESSNHADFVPSGYLRNTNRLV